MSQVKKLTRLGSDTRKIAALLQAKAPKGEMLAYINPKEAALLKAMGGSGKPHADTGIPSFQQEDYEFLQPEPPQLSLPEPTSEFIPGTDFSPGFTQELYGGSPQEIYGFGYGEQAAPAAPVAAPITPSIPTAQQVQPPSGFTLPPNLPLATEGFQLGAMPTPTRVGEPPETSISGKLAEALGLQKRDLLPLGLAGVQSVLGARQGKASVRQGQAARQEMQAMASPYQQQGRALQAQAARGELTPQAQQSLQAVRAQLTQGAQARGGVGAAQVAQQVESVRQQLLQSQADYGLKLSGIGDQIALGAIRAGIQADQYVNQLTGNYMNNIMRMIGQVYIPQQPAVAGGQR